MSDQETTRDINPTRGAVRASLDLVSHNPYVHFVISEFWAAITAFAVYAMTHSTAFGIQFVAALMPLTHNDPIVFLERTLHWGAALGASCTFGIITVYQLVVLMKRLMEDVRK